MLTPDQEEVLKLDLNFAHTNKVPTDDSIAVVEPGNLVRL